MAKKRVLSGTRATGRLHLGNYLGAVKGYIQLSEKPDYETFYMVADLHSINTPYDPKTFQESVRNVVLDYLAAGLNPEKSTIFVQSHVPEHVEFSYLLSTFVSVARMQHLPTFKEKVKQNPENVNMALLYYPVLMAADILIYKANEVPVGIDQLPHLEITREIARKLNETYKTDFPEPRQFKTEGEYTPSLTGEGKMSKSVEGSYINLGDNLDDIRNKLAKVATDMGKGNKIPVKGGVPVLFKLVELFEGVDRSKQYEKLYKTDGVRYRELKEELAQAIYRNLEPIQERREKFKSKPKIVDDIIHDGAQKAGKIASETLKEVKEKMGLL